MSLLPADERHLLRAIELAQLSRENGNHPFGALLVDAADTAVLEAENTVLTENDCTNHAELNLVRAASSRFDVPSLLACTLYTSTEPCGLTHLVDDGDRDSELALPCREVFGRGGRNVEVSGPHLEKEGRAVHEGFWG